MLAAMSIHEEMLEIANQRIAGLEEQIEARTRQLATVLREPADRGWNALIYTAGELRRHLDDAIPRLESHLANGIAVVRDNRIVYVHGRE